MDNLRIIMYAQNEAMIPYIKGYSERYTWLHINCIYIESSYTYVQ